MQQQIWLTTFLILWSYCVWGQTPFSGPTYQSQSADSKDSELFNTVVNNTQSGPWYSWEDVELFIESMNTTFDAIADDMPYQFGGIQRRPKLIHSVGVIAKATWQATSNPFTGVFGKGCKDVLFRLSLARQPDSSTPYTPGISIKCLRDGVHSGNLFAMYSLQGQNSWNFFKHDLTNHVGDLSNSAGFLLSKLRQRFASASDYPVFIGLSDLASYQDDGTEVANPVFPFRLIFHPYINWHNFYPDTQPSTTFQQQLESTLTPGNLYHIYAQIEPEDTMSQFIKIGDIILTSPGSTSLFGDSLMFFQHTRFESDVNYRNDWGPKALAIMAAQRNVDNFVYPDLPFN
eukprot:TRINITY_DN1051_c0_g1_i1.p1 TRINITY_DN1051_c0_g1~~TRINITY_DN1051_c0_g1_i1.p1  ORF type:complete len:354 (+),score=62.81 TRINITY_DN1051_c0_g1_i1:28-1062(+)